MPERVDTDEAETYGPPRQSSTLPPDEVANPANYGILGERLFLGNSLAATPLHPCRRVNAPSPPGNSNHYFVLIDLREKCNDDDSLMEILSACLNEGISLCPGGVFGDSYKYYVRLCFTAVKPDILSRALDILNGIL